MAMNKDNLIKSPSQEKVDRVIKELDRLLKKKNCAIVSTPSINIRTRQIEVSTNIVDLDMLKENEDEKIKSKKDTDTVG